MNKLRQKEFSRRVTSPTQNSNRCAFMNIQAKRSIGQIVCPCQRFFRPVAGNSSILRGPTDHALPRQKPKQRDGRQLELPTVEKE
jgi:hypothetical protein